MITYNENYDSLQPVPRAPANVQYTSQMPAAEQTTAFRPMPVQPPMQNRDGMLRAVMGYDFAAHDILLYLDTHPNDMDAFSIYKEMVSKARTARAAFEARFGPLTAHAAADNSAFMWLDSPWPWSKQGV